MKKELTDGELLDLLYEELEKGQSIEQMGLNMAKLLRDNIDVPIKKIQ